MHRYHTLVATAALLAALLLGACASEIPLLIRDGPSDSPAPTVVREQTGDHLGRQVRWGGRLIETDNRVQDTRLTVLAQPLGKDGEPGNEDVSLGRFIAVVPGFLDPKVYAPDRLVTITGTVQGSVPGMVGEHPYRYPVVAAQAWYLWPEANGAPYDYRYPGWYDPWYGPWWYGAWYDPWYHPRWFDTPGWRSQHHPKPPPGHDTAPGPPVSRQHTPEHRHAQQRPDGGGAPHHAHGEAHPRGTPAADRDHGKRRVTREQPDAGVPNQAGYGAENSREIRPRLRGFHVPAQGFQPDYRESDRGFRLPFRR